MIDYQLLKQALLDYRFADQITRQALLTKAISTASTAKKPPTTVDEAIAINHELACTATLINYADALRRIENQDYFDILIDFKMPKQFESAEFDLLKTYFEFHPTAPQMKLKQPLHAIPSHIWHLFRAAQKTQLAQDGKSDLFNLDQLNIDNLPPNQLYPLPIQMFGQLKNNAVDRISANPQGQYRFAFRFGAYLLPGGGMIERNLENTKEIKLSKMLDEHLEEEHANLWDKAGFLFDKIANDTFKSVLEKNIHASGITEEMKGSLLAFISKEAPNSHIIERCIQSIDEHLEKITDQKARMPYQTLRAGLQVDAFKHSFLYQQALEYIKLNTNYVEIEQFGDVRVCGGEQVSHGFIMIGESLETWFEKKFHGASCELGDDLSGGQLKLLSFLEAVREFRSVKFSHLLIVETHQEMALRTGSLVLDTIWNPEEYTKATQAIKNEGEKVLELIASCTPLVDEAAASSSLGLFSEQKKQRVDFEGAPNPSIPLSPQ